MKTLGKSTLVWAINTPAFSFDSGYTSIGTRESYSESSKENGRMSVEEPIHLLRTVHDFVRTSNQDISLFFQYALMHFQSNCIRKSLSYFCNNRNFESCFGPQNTFLRAKKRMTYTVLTVVSNWGSQARSVKRMRRRFMNGLSAHRGTVFAFSASFILPLFVPKRLPVKSY
jgi:hypothetical protein